MEKKPQNKTIKVQMHWKKEKKKLQQIPTNADPPSPPLQDAESCTLEEMDRPGSLKPAGSKISIFLTSAVLTLVWASTSRRVRSPFIVTPRIGVRGCSREQARVINAFCKFAASFWMCCWLCRFSEFDALLKGNCMTVECLAVVQLEGGYSVLSLEFSLSWHPCRIYFWLWPAGSVGLLSC